jgi:hypothetical protein
MSANGTVSGGYTGSYGSEVQSGHGFNVGGNVNFNGYFYNPNFLSFNVNPYLNDSRSNSSFQAVTDTSGLLATSNIFAGSHFPGSISYSRAYNKQGTFGVPGQTDFVSHGNNQSFNVTWNETLPDVPSLTAGFTTGDSSYDIFGSDQSGSSNFKNFFLHSNYRLAGFSLGGGYTQGNGSSSIPQLFSNGASEETNSDNKNLNFSVFHSLPDSGGASFSYSRSYLNSDYLGYKFNGTIDTINMGAGINPTNKLNVSFGANYSDNLSGQLYQQFVPSNVGSDSNGSSTAAPVLSPTTQLSQESHAWQFNLTSTYAFAPNLLANAEAVHRQQTYGGASFSSDLFGGGLLYGRPWLGGFLNLNGFVAENRVPDTGSNYLSFSSHGSYTRRFGHWNATGSGSYDQSTQSSLISYTTSNYNVTGNVARRFGQFFWTASAGTSRSVLTAQPNTRNSSKSYSTGVGYRSLSLQGSYTESDGNGLITGAGLAPGPLPPVIPSSLLILYGGTGYGVSFSGSPLERLTFSATWNRSRSNTQSQGVFSLNHLEEESVYVQYQMRKVGMTGRYSRLVQGFGTVTGLPANFSTYSVTVYRWFNFF